MSRTRALWPIALLSFGIVAGCNGSGDEEQAASPLPGGGGTQPAPTVSITANPATIDSGNSTTLSWNASNASSCTATGGWSGSKPTDGSESSGTLSGDTTFELSCDGPGGTTSDSVVVTVNGGGAAPVLTLSVSPTQVTAGDTATLTWTSSNTTSCLASGAWMGSKPLNGSESTGSLSGNSTFSMRCDGPDGSVNRSVSVTVVSGTGSGVSGRVDSSLIDRAGQNRVYVFPGDVTPDDVDGDSGDPLLTAPVSQDVGACTFSYDSGDLSPGNYTVAFTSDAASDVPGRDDNLNFYGVTSLSVNGGGAIADFPAANVIRVGPGRAIQRVADAADIAQDGDVVEIDAGLYPGDVSVWYQDNITLRGVGGYAHLRADGQYVQGKGIWVLAGNNAVVENIEFSEVTVPDQNGAGIRADGFNLVVCNGYFHDSEEGILGGAGDVVVEYSEFDNNGFGDGFSHNMYILDAERFTLRYTYTHHARVGHNVKTRARENYILYNRVMDEVSGNSSYAVDIPNGGLSYVIGNLLQQGPSTENFAIVNYGTEGLSGGRTHNLYVVNNTFVNDRGSGVFIQAAGGTSLIDLTNNLFVGSGSLVSGASATETTNVQTTSPGLVDIDQYDYRLTAGSVAIDGGTAPGIGNGFNLTPEFQYLHPQSREDRPVDSAIDVGAYEYSP